jgi:hypothetical protein
MSERKSVSNSLKAFLKNGVEAAECSICRDPVDNSHVVIWIKECGHLFVKKCSENWLKQKDSKRICPACCGVLFMKKPKVRVAQDVIASPRPHSDAPLTPARFNAYYTNTDN